MIFFWSFCGSKWRKTVKHRLPNKLLKKGGCEFLVIPYNYTLTTHNWGGFKLGFIGVRKSSFTTIGKHPLLYFVEFDSLFPRTSLGPCCLDHMAAQNDSLSYHYCSPLKKLILSLKIGCESPSQ